MLMVHFPARDRLHEAKVYGQLGSAAALAYVDGSGTQDLAAVVEALRREQEQEAAQATRRERVRLLLEADGLSGLHSWECW